MNPLIAVVLCGGSGKRLWPVSVQSKPKPFAHLIDDETFLEKTYKRLHGIKSLYNNGNKPYVLTVTAKNYYQHCNEAAKKSGVYSDFILEAKSINTAAAVSLAVNFVINKFGLGAKLLVMPADHLIEGQGEFGLSVNAGLEAANKGGIVTFGIKPRYPETGYGYIQAKNISNGVAAVSGFFEKPSIEGARLYLDDGSFYWNSGILCFRAEEMRNLIEVHAPTLSNSLKFNCKESDLGPFVTKLEDYDGLNDISIDKAVLEKAESISMVEVGFEWDDIGSWASLMEKGKHEDCGNRSIGKSIKVRSSNVSTYSRDKLVTSLGVRDIYIIEANDIVLVCHKDELNNINEISNAASKNDFACGKLNKLTVRPWGTFEVIDEGMGYKIKKINVYPGGKLSMQSHAHRSEHWVVVSGEAQVTNDSVCTVLLPNQSTYIEVGSIHRLENVGNENCCIIEVQCGSILSENDIVRYDDIYGRN
ncbi:MAG: Mannose-1-phosphate guanylyltransferase [Fluviibacter phosphoraccumulans EoVTN8]